MQQIFESKLKVGNLLYKIPQSRNDIYSLIGILYLYHSILTKHNENKIILKGWNKDLVHDPGNFICSLVHDQGDPKTITCSLSMSAGGISHCLYLCDLAYRDSCFLSKLQKSQEILC